MLREFAKPAITFFFVNVVLIFFHFRNFSMANFLILVIKFWGCAGKTQKFGYKTKRNSDENSVQKFHFDSTMQNKIVFFLAFIGMAAIAKAQPQFDLSQIVKSLTSSDGAKKVIDAALKLKTDTDKMKADKKFDGVLLKQDIEAIVKAAEDNKIPISQATRDKIKALLASIDKMIELKTYDPSELSLKGLDVFRSIMSEIKLPRTIPKFV